MNLRPGRILLHLGQLLLRVGIWLTARWAETAQAVVEREPEPMPPPMCPLRVALRIHGEQVDFSEQPREQQALVALNWFLGALTRRHRC